MNVVIIVSLIVIEMSQRFSLYNDSKTEALYSQITNLHPPHSYEEQALLKEAEQKTEINSHYSLTDPQQYLSNFYIYSGVSLVQTVSSDAYKYKYRPYTILKTTQETKQPISQQELYKRLASRRHEQIVYRYGNSTVNSVPQEPALSSIKLISDSFLDQANSKSVGKLQVQVRAVSEDKAKNRPKFTKSKDKGAMKRISQKTEKSGRVSRSNLKKDESANFPIIETDQEKYTFKSVKNRAIAGSKNARKGAYNLFSCLDEPVSKQCSNEEYECGPNEIVAAKLGSQNWRK